ncbi:MAG: S-methyl-5-thioribose-1-phosphate isomerase, partial [Neomegalonema sp.]|nr:S-methyl-5-thioribose-1-phosphate isomerase [Neomegalonema sp.]
MKINGEAWRPIWDENGAVKIIDQTKLPFALETVTLHDVDAAERAIREMLVRGAPLIGATAAYGMALAMRQDASDAALQQAYDFLLASRPTAINLRWALDRSRAALAGQAATDRADAGLAEARALVEEDVAINKAIGEAGLPLIIAAAERSGGRVHILTHCNAGWLATCDWGTATSPIYQAQERGVDLHVWVDETRPRLQGAYLTACELGWAGIPHSVIVDNAGGHLMQRGEVDLCFVGTDRVTSQGDVCNKIGTYLKALAAKDNNVPFYVCLPSPTIDWRVADGLEIPIEYRDEAEVLEIQGVRIAAPGSPAENPGFDVTPARLVTGLVTERGIAAASAE